MKKFLLILCAIITAFAANAQIVTSRSRSITNIETRRAPSENYTRWYAGYNSFSIDDDAANGVDLGFLKGFNIASIPLYLEAGAEVGYNYWSDSEGRYEISEHMLNASIPLSISYKIDLAEGFSLMPFTGPNFRFNVLHKLVVEYDGDSESEDADQNVFQFGWNVGVGLTYNSLYFGYRYTNNISKYYDGLDEKGMVHSLHIGVQF